MRRIQAAFALCAALLGGTAAADPLNITGIGGSWINPNPAVNITALSNAAGSGTDAVRWGGVAGNLNTGSGYNFTPAGDLVPVLLNVPFALGLFTHINQPIFSAITDIQYAFQFSTNGAPATVADIFNFSHNETPNNTGTSPADDDIVTIGALSLNQLITVGADTFFFNLLGFSLDGGITLSNVFRSPEGGFNSATLYAVITEVPINRTPEPGTIALLMGTLLGLRFVRKKG